ncbi:Alcohol dehydrogenase superfamily zinc-containing [Macrophomina phaseolina MS6]|uniref:Alcohol dehydrogenase superfamily zinc-containing n=1 Tax=Macrophomina phaseolina (strain MS6) TaxID=1126212 RepID=K2QX55_MACPH|nr:Alcohol dehydrogenase superfamily zinc-containing [Macrophomina phaseolina MS6]
MMRGVVYSGVPYEMAVMDLPLPTILNETDAIVRITTSAICGSDLHIYRGVSGGTPPWTVGHEAMGYISEIGSAVTSLSVGDYVVIPDTAGHGHLQMEPEGLPFFGYGQEISDGLQAEYARVPAAEANLIPVPLTHNTTNRTIEQNYLTVGDIFSTGWTALDYSGFQPGDSVAIFGAGPVGLLAAYSAILRGASRVYSVDHVPARLERAASIGAIPINFVESDPAAQILEHEPQGVTRTVDAVGMEAVNAQLEIEAGVVISSMLDVAGIRGGVGVAGVYAAQPDSPGAPLGSTINPNITFSISDFWSKRLSMRGGGVDPTLVAPELVRLIASGKAHPNFIKSAEISIEEVPEYYERFNRQEEIKVYIHFD